VGDISSYPGDALYTLNGNTLARFYGVVSRVKLHLVIRSISSARPTAPLASTAIPNHTTEVFLYLYSRHDLLALEEFRKKKRKSLQIDNTFINRGQERRRR